MKIAILLSGRIRGYAQSYSNMIHHIVQGNEVDFFASYPKDTSNEELIEFLKMFQPKVFIRSDEEYFSIEKYSIPTHIHVKSPHNMMCMYLNRNRVYELFEKYKNEKNQKYDLVLSCRVDFIIHSKLDLSLLFEKSKEDLICIPAGEDHNGINDRMAIGNEKMMKEYMTCYQSLQYLLDHGGTFHPETILKEYFEYKEMKTFRFPLGTHIIS